jgi:hypothetical protein
MKTTHTASIALALLVASLGTAGAEGFAYKVTFSSAVVLALPAETATGPVVYVRGPEESWRPGEFKVEDGRIVMSLDPATFKGGRALILINPPEGMDIHDSRPPELVGIVVDGVPQEPSDRLDLGAGERWPRRIEVKVVDRENLPDPASAAMQLGGLPVENLRAVPGPQPNTLLLRARLRKPDYGDHQITYSVADNSPQANRLTGTIGFGRFDLTNYVIAVQGATLTPDSSFSGYDDMAVLQDGIKPEAGSSLPGSISWASAETDAPHWVEVDFGQPREVREVSLHWANYSHELHTSRCFEVQVPEGDGWRTVYRSPEAGEKPGACTTAEFAPQTLSRLRVYQPAGCGSPARPNLMWLTEIEAR